MYNQHILFQSIILFFIYRPSNSTYYIFNEDADNSSVHWIFKLGFMYYSLLGTLLVAIVGYPISIISGGTKNLDQKLLAPIFRKRIIPNGMTFIQFPDEIDRLQEK